jgi:hypothetical protein
MKSGLMQVTPRKISGKIRSAEDAFEGIFNRVEKSFGNRKAANCTAQRQ